MAFILLRRTTIHPLAPNTAIHSQLRNFFPIPQLRKLILYYAISSSNTTLHLLLLHFIPNHEDISSLTPTIYPLAPSTTFSHLWLSIPFYEITSPSPKWDILYPTTSFHHLLRHFILCCDISSSSLKLYYYISYLTMAFYPLLKHFIPLPQAEARQFIP